MQRADGDISCGNGALQNAEKAAAMDLFDYMRANTMEKESPLASRMRPTTLDEVVGQKHIIGKDKLLYRAIKADKLGSVIFYGPPGTGKTTLAKVIAKHDKCPVRADQCDCSREKRYGRDRKERQGFHRYVRAEDDPLRGRDPSL